MFYAAGYVIQKLIKKHRQRSDEQALEIMGALLNMIGQDIVGDMHQDTTSCIDYVKTWTRNNDRGGLRHVSNDTYRCFLAIETIIYKLIVAGGPKDKVLLVMRMSSFCGRLQLICLMKNYSYYCYKKLLKNGSPSEGFQY